MDKNKVQKTAMVGGIVVCVFIAALLIFIKVNSQKIADNVSEMVIARGAQAVNGGLSAGGIDVSLFGATILHNVVLTDRNGTVILTGDTVSIDYSIYDLVRNNFSLGSVKTVTVSGLKLNLIQSREGGWNFATASQETLEPTLFRGKVVVENASVSVALPQASFELQSVEGIVAFADFPQVKADFTGKQNGGAVSLKGFWAQDGLFAFVLNAACLDIAQIGVFLPDNPLRGGVVRDVALTIRGDEAASVTYEGQGEVSQAVADINGTVLSDISGSFSVNRQHLNFAELGFSLAGQRLTGEGSIILGERPQLDVSLAAQKIELAAVAAAEGVTGAVSFQAKVTGPVDRPTVYGSFQLPAGTVGGNAFADASGNFRYSGAVIAFEQGVASAWGGRVSFAGSYDVASAYFNQQVSGQDVDSSLLTGGVIPGRADFAAAVSGREAGSLRTEGTFAMKTGTTVSGFALSSLDGSFVKQGNLLQLRQVNLVTGGHSFYARGQIVLDSPVELDIIVGSGGFDIAAFQPDGPTKGVAAFEAAIAGTAEDFRAAGQFSLAAGSLGGLDFTDANGDFHYNGRVLTLRAAQARALGGKITAAGTVTKTAYNQKITGAGVEAAYFTDGDVDGRADFSAQIQGQGDWAGATADGSFSIKQGTAKGLPFSDLTGDFQKRGRQTDFSNVSLQLAGGLIRGTADSEGDYIRLKLAAGDSPLAVLLGPSLDNYMPRQDLLIKFRGAG